MEADLPMVYESTSFCFLFLHGISVPFHAVIDPLIDAFSAYDAKVSQSIIGEVEDLGISGMCPHEVVPHDGDEALVVLAHAIHDILLHDLIEFLALIEYEVDRFHFLIALLTRCSRTHSLLSSSFLRRKSFLVRFSFIQSLYMSPSTV